MLWPMLIASAPLALAPIDAYPMVGGVDGNGCHTNKKTGDYHCHGGRSPSPRTSRFVYSAPALPRRSQPKLVAAAAAGPATLVSVGDGDTIRAGSNGQKVTIRIACIEAPETAQGESGTQATLVLKQLLAAGPVEIRLKIVDRYGRTVAEIYSDGRNVNLELDRMVLTYAYRDYLGGCDANAYLDAEAQAEHYRQGGWREGNEVKPWDFRMQKRVK